MTWAALCEVGQFLAGKGWAPATSGNYSLRMPDKTIAITVSGVDKGTLTDHDIMLLDQEGRPITQGKKSSAETLLHVTRYQDNSDIKAILHTHSVTSVVLSRHLGKKPFLTLEGYELLKAFPGIDTHDTCLDIPIFDNSQDMTSLAKAVSQASPQYGYIIRGHGVYAWGQDMAEAKRCIEALEFMLECELNHLMLRA